MNVFHINEHIDLKGGVETYLHSVIPLLSEHGINSVVVHGAKAETAVPLKSIHMPVASNTHLKSIIPAYHELLELFRKESPDLIHIHNVQNTGVLRAAFEYGPTVVTTHDHRWICPANNFYYRRTQEVCQKQCGPGCFTTTLFKRCLTPRPQYALRYYRRTKWASSHADNFAHIIAPSRDALKRYSEAGFNRDRISVVPYFCSLKPLPEPRPLPENPTITYLGRIASNKGHEYFVETLGMLPENVKGIMVGGFTEENRRTIFSLASQYGCGKRLELRGWASRQEVIQLLDETSVFIFPSLWPETLGIVGIEALSRGVPVVASNIGGVPEWCIENETGYLVPPKNAQMMRDAVWGLIDDKEKLYQFGKNGLNLINRKFLPEHHISSLLDIYQKAIS